MAIHVALSPRLNPPYAATTRRSPRFAATAAKPSRERRSRAGKASIDGIAVEDGTRRGAGGARMGGGASASVGSVEAAGSKEQPRESAAKAARALRRVEGERMELLDRRAEDRLQRFGQSPGKLELSP